MESFNEEANRNLLIMESFNEEAPQIKSHYSTEDVTSDNEDQSTG